MGKNKELDLCCRTHYECEAHKKVELNLPAEWKVWHCDCEQEFRKCLHNVNTVVANDFGFMHFLNTTKCYAEDHAIVECEKFESIFEPKTQFQRSPDDDERRYRNCYRCIQYRLDESSPKQYQIFDLPFDFHGQNINDLEFIKEYDILKAKKSYFFICYANKVKNVWREEGDAFFFLKLKWGKIASEEKQSTKN